MDVKTAQAVSDAVMKTGEDRTDFRTEEAKFYSAWVGDHLTPYISKGDSVLDVGCSSGKASFALDQLGAKVTGIDCSRVALRLARAVALDIGSDAMFVRGDYNNLPFPDGHFDVAVFPQNIVECSYHEISNLMASIKRVLCDGGQLLLSLKDPIETQNFPKNYDLLSGEKRSKVTVPEHGTHDYPCYFWTVAFAKYIVSQHLTFVECVPMDREIYLLVFAK